MSRQQDIWKKHKRNQREIDKKIRQLYNTPEARPGESFTDFKRRHRRILAFSLLMSFSIYVPLVL